MDLTNKISDYSTYSFNMPHTRCRLLPRTTSGMMNRFALYVVTSLSNYLPHTRTSATTPNDLLGSCKCYSYELQEKFFFLEAASFG